MRRLVALIALLLAGFGTAYALAGENAANTSCDPSVSEALLANRIVGGSQSYRRDNPSEYAAVRAYLDGGSRPTGVTTHMGLHLVYLEDTCRAADVTVTTTTTGTVTTTVTTTVTQPTTTTTTTTTPPPPTCTQTISSGLSTAITNAAAGTTICLNAANYGALTLSSLSKSSDVTIQPVSGAVATIGAVNFNNVNHLRFTGTTGTLNIAGLHMDISSGTSTNLTFDHAAFTAPVTVNQRGSNQAILFDADTFDNLGQGDFEGRFNVRGFGNSSPFGLTISNSHFGNGGCSDGIQFVGSSYGAVVGPGNEFEGILQAGCDPAHVDPIQLYDCDHITVTGNWIHDNDTALMSGDAACQDVTISNNVFGSLGASQAIYCSGCANWVVQHNVCNSPPGAPADDVFFGNEKGVNATGNLVRDNVFTANCVLYVPQAGWGTNDHNLNSGQSGTGNISGTPIFVGGANPSTWAGFALATGSPGKGAGTGGSDMGIVP